MGIGCREIVWRQCDVSARPFLSIVIPTYNRVETLVGVVERVMPFLPPTEVEVLVVDDGSIDATAEGCGGLQAQWPNFRAVHRKKNGGYPRALITSFREARGEWVLVNSDDDELNGAETLRLIENLSGLDADFVSTQWLSSEGSPYRGRSRRRRIWSGELRSAANHAPALAYRRSAVLPLLQFLEALCDEGDDFAAVYPQVVLAAHLVASRRGVWWPYPVGVEGEGLPSGLRDPHGRVYWDREARVAQGLRFRGILRLMECQSGVERRYRMRVRHMNRRNEAATVWSLDQFMASADPGHRSTYRMVSVAMAGRLTGWLSNRLSHLADR